MEKCDPKIIQDQLNRTEGQVVALRKMVAESRPCAEVLQQIVAARASLSRLGTLLLEAEAQGCLSSLDGSSVKVKDLERTVTNLFKLT